MHYTPKPADITYAALLVKGEEISKGEIVLSGHGPNPTHFFYNLILPFRPTDSRLEINIEQSYEDDRNYYVRNDPRSVLKKRGKSLSSQRMRFLEIILAHLEPELQEKLDNAQPLPQQRSKKNDAVKKFSLEMIKDAQEGIALYVEGTVKIPPEELGAKAYEVPLEYGKK